MADSSKKVNDDNEENSDVCSICLGVRNSTRTGKLNCCSHHFCFECITEWSAQGKTTCPLDRMSFEHIELYENGILDASQTYYPPARPQPNQELLTYVIENPQLIVFRIYSPERECNCAARSSSDGGVQSQENRILETIPQEVVQDHLLNAFLRHQPQDLLRLSRVMTRPGDFRPRERFSGSIRALLPCINCYDRPGRPPCSCAHCRRLLHRNDASTSANGTNPPNDDNKKSDS